MNEAGCRKKHPDAIQESCLACRDERDARNKIALLAAKRRERQLRQTLEAARPFIHAASSFDMESVMQIHKLVEEGLEILPPID